MAKFREYSFFKGVVLFLLFMLILPDIPRFANKNALETRFLEAKAEFNSGNYLECKKNLQYLRALVKVDSPQLLGRVYLLLAAANEKLGAVIEAREYYILARIFFPEFEIRDINLSTLSEYKRVKLMKNISENELRGPANVYEQPGKKKKRKKFPWILVIGGIAAVIVIILLLTGKSSTDSLKEVEIANDIIDESTWITIPAGEFVMGNEVNGSIPDENPPHKVYLDSYQIAKEELTFELYDKYCEVTGRVKPEDQGWGRGSLPVILISWYEANLFCNWLSQRTGKNIHLPTEAQWERAAKSLRKNKYPWGNSEPNCTMVNFLCCKGKTMPVGTYPSSATLNGIQDLAGNVAEWCQDWYSWSYYATLPYSNPIGPEYGSYKIVRGGGWKGGANYLRCADRGYLGPADILPYIGFRLVMD